jgi:O-antigen ligase
MDEQRVAWSARADRWRDVAVLSLVLIGAAAIPLVFIRDPSEMFRLPKALFLRAEAILLVAVALGAVIAGAPLPRVHWRDPAVLLPLIVFAIFALVTMTSTNHEVSLGALASAAATLVIYFATIAAARRRAWLLVAVPLVAALANTLLVVVEETRLWMPFGQRTDIPHHLQCTALIGSPNEIGGYLGAATLACLALALAGGMRVFARVAAALLVIGLIASQSLTALVAFGAAGIAAIALVSWRKALVATTVAVVIAALVVASFAPLRTRATNVVRWVRGGEYNELMTERLTAFAAAWSMFRARPVLGVGPGTFSWRYYGEKIAAEQRHPSLRRAYNRGVNYGEAHNDHLQVLAEGGLVGYAAFASLMVALAAFSFAVPRDAIEPRRRFVRALALPLAVFWIVLSIAQFPLETTVVRTLLVHLAALCAAWRDA